MNQKEVTKTFIMISNCKILLATWIIQKYISVVRVNPYTTKLDYFLIHLISRVNSLLLGIIGNECFKNIRFCKCLVSNKQNAIRVISTRMGGNFNYLIQWFMG